MTIPSAYLTEPYCVAVQRPSRTRWFSAQTEPPVRPGMYERTCGLWVSVGMVSYPSDEWLNTCKFCKWRGLSTNPNEPKRGQRTK